MLTLDNLLFPLTLFAALGCALMAGLFFAFSVAVMDALTSRPPAEGIAAMQAINVAILNPVFGVVFFGTAVACVLLAIAAAARRFPSGATHVLLGCALYLIGTFLLTVVIHVPRNNALAALSPTASGSAALWLDYVPTWTAWNHVRAALSLAATASFIFALRG